MNIFDRFWAAFARRARHWASREERKAREANSRAEFWNGLAASIEKRDES